MKRKYLIVLIIFALLGILLCYYIFACMNSLIPKAVAIEDSDFIKNFILENEKQDSNLKTFVAIKEIATEKKPKIIHKEKFDFYALVLIDTYNVENELLEHNQSITKLYKFILKGEKVLDSNNINVEDISSYNDYGIFPKEIITKCLQIKDSVDLTEKIKKQIENYYYENNDKIR